MFGPRQQKIARDIIMGYCNYVISTDLSVEDYTEVLQLWNTYLENNTLPLNIKESKILCEVFTFHKTCMKDHAILYSCNSIEDAILLYKIEGEYFNVLVSDEGLDTDNRNIVSVFTAT